MNLPWPFHSRRQELVEQPFPEEWLPFVARLEHYSLLTPDEQFRLRGDLRVFVAEKNWEGVQGLEVSDEIKLVVSALACLLTVGFEQHDYFPNVQTVIVYPYSYVPPARVVMGQVNDSTGLPTLGEAHENGPIVLSWPDIVDGYENTNDGHNLVLHEFAHKLDFRDGDANGVPLLRDSAEVDDWAAVMSVEFEALVSDTEHGHHTLLQAYGATNPAEFFAVCTECFFEKSLKMREQKPDLYRILKDYYGIDWAERRESASGRQS